MSKKAKIYYFRAPNMPNKTAKLEQIRQTSMPEIIQNAELIRPDKNGNWINQTDNDFEDLIPLCSKKTKLSKEPKDEKAIFKLFSLGVVTARDAWVYDFKKQNLQKKVTHFIEKYNNEVERLKGISKKNVNDKIDYSIKWTRAVKNDLVKGKKYIFEKDNIVKMGYRPFVKKYLYFARDLNEMQYKQRDIFGEKASLSNQTIILSDTAFRSTFTAISAKVITELHFAASTDGFNCLPFYRYEEGKRLENITDWALGEFRETYKVFENLIGLEEGLEREIEKIDIFHYVYGVLHNPEYRQKYEQNLKRDFPRIPFYKDFWQWADWGKELMHLHLNYETAKKYPLKKTDKPLKNPEATPKAKLRRDKKTDEIILDEVTTLSNIPTEAWDYKLGNRSALEWILDQYKEKKPRDKTIAEKFNTYRFADYKESVIDLLRRVCTVSIETMRIIGEMEKVDSKV